MIRWTYLFPRLIILFLIVIAVWVGKDPLIRFVVIRSLQDSTGAKVEIGTLRSSLNNQTFLVKDVSIADPGNPMGNLVQAEMAFIEFDFRSLLHRRFVIENCQTSNIRFGSPRTVSGAMDGSVTRPPSSANKWKPQPLASAEKLARDWIDQLSSNSHGMLSPEDFELVRVTQDLKPYWDLELPAIQKQIDQLHINWVQLGKDARYDRANPLRARRSNADADYALIRQQTATIEKKIGVLYDSVERNRMGLNQAFARDVAKLQPNTYGVNFDEDQISKLLLTQLQDQYVSEIVGWFAWFRATVPDPASDFSSKRLRGAVVNLTDGPQAPGFLIKSIELDGEGRFANQHFDFVGTAYNLTSQPSRLAEPATFELRAQGNRHVIVSCTLDRRTEQAIDTLKINCPELEMDEQLLGEKNSLLVTMGPASKIQAEIQLQTVGDKITGTIVFRHSNVSLHVDKIHEMAGGQDAALQLNQGLASIDRFETTIHVTGSIDDYAYDFSTDLGKQFANSANTVLAQANQLQVQRQKSELEKLKTSQIHVLDNEITSRIQSLGKLLADESAQVASLGNLIQPSDGRLKKYH